MPGQPRPQRLAGRAVAALLSLALTALLLAALDLPRMPALRAAGSPPGPQWIVWPTRAEPPAAPRLTDEPARTPRPAARPRPPQPRDLRTIEAIGPAVTLLPVPMPAPPAAAPASIGELPDRLVALPVPAASTPPSASPLRMDEATLRAAHQASKSAVQRMAETGGHSLHPDPVSSQQRLAAAVVSSGKPDCLAADAGGSLLSIPRLAYWALAGKCR